MRLQGFRSHGRGWFDFVRSEGDLSKIEAFVMREGSDWLCELETSAMSKCLMMVVTEVLLERDALTLGMELAELADRC